MVVMQVCYRLFVFLLLRVAPKLHNPLTLFWEKGIQKSLRKREDCHCPIRNYLLYTKKVTKDPDIGILIENI